MIHTPKRSCTDDVQRKEIPKSAISSSGTDKGSPSRPSRFVPSSQRNACSYQQGSIVWGYNSYMVLSSAGVSVRTQELEWEFLTGYVFYAYLPEVIICLGDHRDIFFGVVIRGS